MRKRSLVVSWLLMLLLGTVLASAPACHKVVVTDVPAGVVDKEVAAWFEATGAMKTVSEASLGLTQAAVDLHSSGVFPDEGTYQTTLASLGKINQVGLQATNFLQLTPQHFGSTEQSQLAGYIDQAIAVLGDANQVGLLQIKNPQKQQQVSTLLTGLQSALKTIFAIVKPAGTPVPAVLTNKIGGTN